MPSNIEHKSSNHSWPIHATVGYYLAFVLLGMVVSAFAPIIPALSELTHSGLDRLSSALAATSLGYMLGAFIGGQLYDRFSGHQIMAGCLFIIGILLTVVPSISLLWVLAFVLLVLGVMEGAVDTGGNSLLVWLYGSRVPPFMNGLHFFFGVGAFLAPILIVQVASKSGDNLDGFYLFALLAFVTAVYLLRLPSPAIPERTSPGVVSSVKPLLVVLFVLFFFLYVGAELAYGNWIYTYALRLSLASEMTAAYLTSAFWGTFTLGRLLAIPLAVRYRPQMILLFDLLGCLFSIIIILLMPASSIVLWIGTLFLGLSMASIFPMALSYAEQRIHLTGKITGWFLVGTGAGGMFLPWVSGQLFAHLGLSVLMWLLLIDLLVNLALFVILLRYRSA